MTNEEVPNSLKLPKLSVIYAGIIIWYHFEPPPSLLGLPLPALPVLPPVQPAPLPPPGGS